MVSCYLQDSSAVSIFLVDVGNVYNVQLLQVFENLSYDYRMYCVSQYDICIYTG